MDAATSAIGGALVACHVAPVVETFGVKSDVRSTYPNAEDPALSASVVARHVESVSEVVEKCWLTNLLTSKHLLETIKIYMILIKIVKTTRDQNCKILNVTETEQANIYSYRIFLTCHYFITMAIINKQIISSFSDFQVIGYYCFFLTHISNQINIPMKYRNKVSDIIDKAIRRAAIYNYY